MPWMVFLFFVLVVPAGVVSIVLIMLQPVIVGSWCTLCLITAVTTLISIPPAVDEVFASVQFLLQARRDNKSVWSLFWKGEQQVSKGESKEAGKNSHSLAGLDFQWNLLVTTVLGIWIVLTPPIFELPHLLANSNYITGALVTTFAVLATAEPIRSLRLINILFGLWVALSPFLFRNGFSGSTWNQVTVGLILIPLSLPKGEIKEKYGPWDRFIV